MRRYFVWFMASFKLKNMFYKSKKKGKREQIIVLWNVVLPENSKDLLEGTV